MTVQYKAMLFARDAHKDQVRKYSGDPYSNHLAEVAGILATVTHDPTSIAVAWLHDTIEDCGVTREVLQANFGYLTALAVEQLSDLETGNRAQRKAASRARLSQAPGWVQTIKCADMISNTSSIVSHDPKFAKTYLAEKKAMLAVLDRADPLLLKLANDQCDAGLAALAAMNL